MVLLRQSVVDADHAGAHLQVVRESDSSVTVQVPAGLTWDQCVAETVARGWGGIECLSGIPGQVGATPVQNVGAYGVEMESVLQRVQLVDRLTGAVEWETADRLDLRYRYSNMKFTHRAVVT
ncbi:FAD-binding protein, partial [Citrobacter koseri]